MERLVSDRLEERDEALQELRTLEARGVAKPEEPAFKGSPENSPRGRRILVLLEVMATPAWRLLQAIPGIQDRREKAQVDAWAEALPGPGKGDLEGDRRHPTL